MTPLPEAVQQAFPCASDRVPARPWWRCVESYDMLIGVPVTTTPPPEVERVRCGHYVRSDYTRLDLLPTKVSWTPGAGAQPGPVLPPPPTSRDVDEWLAYIDAVYPLPHPGYRAPLPHPGYRAGQVWAAGGGESIQIARVTQREDGGFNIWTGSTRREGWVWWLVCTDRPSLFATQYPFLLADPACPHLAPWSPA